MRPLAFVRGARFAGLLWLAAAMPLRAQRPDSAHAVASEARRDSAAAPLSGPRLQDRWQPARLQFARHSAAPDLAASGATFRFSTLELVLILVIVLLLIVR